MMPRRVLAVCMIVMLTASVARCKPPAPETGPGDRMLAEYFTTETARLRDACLADVDTLGDWERQRETRRRELLEMLGLDPLPERTDLKATVTGTLDQETFTVEKLHFQSRPGLYVTGNLYVPKGLEKPAPAILYVCGHGPCKVDGVSYGNKVSYHHHGCWFARHGYVCLVIDSLQMGEIEATHHGTYRYDMWWWNNRGYTPAGVEAWNCVRAIDYLQSRGEVDPQRIGVTGRSGGGAYSWWIAAIDERIKAAVPVAGITDLENHVVDGCVEGHCDCMFFVNTHRWDYPMVAALVAPRPLLIANSDADGIFPLDGVRRTYEKARRVYALHDAEDKIGLVITEGPHKDTRELRVPAFRWFDKHLMGVERKEYAPAEKSLEPQQLKVFAELPADQINTKIHETFVPAATDSPLPKQATGWGKEWTKMRTAWRKALEEKVFAGWPKELVPLDVEEEFLLKSEYVIATAYDFTSQENVRLRMLVVRAADANTPAVHVELYDAEVWGKMEAAYGKGLTEGLVHGEATEELRRFAHDACSTHRAQQVAYVIPRGIGPTAWNPNPRKQIQIRRRFMLLGQTLDGMRIWDVRRAIAALRTLPQFHDAPITLNGRGQAAGWAVYAALFEPRIVELELRRLARIHREGPILLNVNRYLDLPQALAMALGQKRSVRVYGDGLAMKWAFPTTVARLLGLGQEHLELIEKKPVLPGPY